MQVQDSDFQFGISMHVHALGSALQFAPICVQSEPVIYVAATEVIIDVVVLCPDFSFRNTIQVVERDLEVRQEFLHTEDVPQLPGFACSFACPSLFDFWAHPDVGF